MDIRIRVRTRYGFRVIPRCKLKLNLWIRFNIPKLTINLNSKHNPK